MKQNITKISDPDRIQRIFARAVATQLPVLMRDIRNPTVAVRGRCHGLKAILGDRSSPSSQALNIIDVSERGTAYLHELEKVKLEIAMPSLKLVCGCPVLRIDRLRGIVELALPREVYSYERRTLTRTRVNPLMPVSLHLRELDATEPSLLVPIVFPHLSHLASRLPVSDISLGGLSVATIYPGYGSFLTPGKRYYGESLHLPLRPPVTVELALRWARRVEQKTPLPKRLSGSVRSYVAGFEFCNPDPNLQQAIRSYLQRAWDHDSL